MFDSNYIVNGTEQFHSNSESIHSIWNKTRLIRRQNSSNINRSFIAKSNSTVLTIEIKTIWCSWPVFSD